MSEQTNASRHPQALLEQIAGVLGLPYADDNLPELVAKLAAREKLYTETVNAIAPALIGTIEVWELLSERHGPDGLRQLLSLAREGAK